MDRFDDLLIKARAEMIGKAPKRNVVTKDAAFNMAWDMVKGYEDQMRALQAKRNRPGFMQRMKDSYRANRNPPTQQQTQQQGRSNVPLPTRSQATQNVPLPGEREFTDFMQPPPPTPAETPRAIGTPPTMEDLGPGGLGQEGGAERPPKALEPEEVPMRDERSPEPEPVRAPGPTGPPPAKTTAARGAPPSFPGQSPSVRAKIGGVNRQALLDAFGTLNPENKTTAENMLRVNAPQSKTVGGSETRGEASRPLDPADIPMVSEQEQLSPRTQGQLGERRDAVRDDEYNRIMEQRNKISDRRVRRINSGDMTSGEAIRELKRIRDAGKYPDLPTMQEDAPMSRQDAMKVLGGETLSPNTRSPAVETPIQETTQGGVPYRRTGMKTNYPGQSTALVPTKKKPATEPLEPEQVMAMQRQPKGGPPAVRGKGGAREPLRPDQLPMRGRQKQLPAPREALGEDRQLPQEAGGGQSQREGRQGGINEIIDRRRPVEERNLSNQKRAAQRRSRNKDFNKPASKVEEESAPVKEPEPQQVEEQTESVKQPEPQVEEQATKTPPTANQGTLFGGDEQTSSVPKDDKATIEAAQERKEKRRQQNEEREVLQPIRTMDSEDVMQLIYDAQEGKKAARSHLYNSVDEIERVHPHLMDEIEDLFGDTFKMSQDTNLSLLPSGMRQNLLKENDADVNYSLLPNGWV